MKLDHIVWGLIGLAALSQASPYFLTSAAVLAVILFIKFSWTPFKALRCKRQQGIGLWLIYSVLAWLPVYLLGVWGWVGTVLALAGWLFVYVIFTASEKKNMDLFSFSSNPDKLQDFFEEGKTGQRQALTFDVDTIKPRILAEVIGQNRVVDEVITTLSRRIRLNRPNKPIATFLFVGPTGTGKTELSKAIANAGFDGKLIRFDMGEFSGAHTAARLVGSPPGYVGSDKGGELPQAIWANKSGVLLFDEIEKADPEIYKLLLPLLDEGRITESSTGRVADASQFVIILTSNAAHDKLAELAATITNPQELNASVKDTLRGVFTPEQLARLDNIFCFNALPRRAIAEIALKFLVKFASECGVQLAPGGVDSELFIDFVLRHEKQSNYGIRELIRLVENTVVDGFLEAKDAGFQQVRIVLQGEEITVEGIAA